MGKTAMGMKYEQMDPIEANAAMTTKTVPPPRGVGTVWELLLLGRSSKRRESHGTSNESAKVDSNREMRKEKTR